MTRRAILAIDGEMILDTAIVTPERRREIDEAQAKSGRMPSIRPYEWRIVTLGHALVEWVEDPATNDDLPRITRFGAIGGPDWREPEILGGFYELVRLKRRPRLLTWNGRTFDLPTIEARALVAGIADSGFAHAGFDYRFSADKNLDLMDKLSNFGAGTRLDLDGMAKACGFPGKPPGIDGGRVEAMFAAGRIGEIEDYALCDVANLLGIAFRWMFHVGEIGARIEREGQAQIRQVLAARGGDILAPMAEAWPAGVPDTADLRCYTGERPQAAADAMGGDLVPPRQIDAERGGEPPADAAGMASDGGNGGDGQ